MKKEINHDLGLVLSGGGLRGVVHIGFLKALLENDIEPNCIAGTSAGAWIGALYAAGYSTDVMTDFFKELIKFRFSKIAIKSNGLLSYTKLQDFFALYFKENNFETLKKPLFVCTTNIEKGCSHYFSNGELIKPLLASAALPPLFSPVMINNETHTDGGIMDNFPISPLLSICENVIGSFACPLIASQRYKFKNPFHILHRAYYLTRYADALQKFEHCQAIFEPTKISKYGMMPFRKIDNIIEIGYLEGLKWVARFEIT